MQQILTDFERRLLNWWFYNTVKRNKMKFFLQIISLSIWRQNLPSLYAVHVHVHVHVRKANDFTYM